MPVQRHPHWQVVNGEILLSQAIIVDIRWDFQPLCHVSEADNVISYLRSVEAVLLHNMYIVYAYLQTNRSLLIVEKPTSSCMRTPLYGAR